MNPNGSVSDTIASAHAVLHAKDTGGTFEQGHADMSQIHAFMRSIDSAIKTGFAKVDNRLDSMQQSLNL